MSFLPVLKHKKAKQHSDNPFLQQFSSAVPVTGVQKSRDFTVKYNKTVVFCNNGNPLLLTEAR
jgi:hypothetical protein